MFTIFLCNTQGKIRKNLGEEKLGKILVRKSQEKFKKIKNS
jgi:hypothetical protein